MNAPDNPSRLDRRVAIKWMLTAAASITVLDRPGASAASALVRAQGYGPDPSMVKIYKPGDVWPLTMNAKQRRAATALCDVMIPADETSPSASQVGVVDFLDEWVSSPYPGQVGDRTIVLEGLAWIDAEAQRRHGVDFADLSAAQQEEICDDICDPKAAKKEHAPAVKFFKRFRDLVAGGYYTTPQGWKDIGYVGNVALAAFPGPPIEALKHVGLA